MTPFCLIFSLADNLNGGDVRVYAVVPVEEAFHVDNFADLEVLYCGVNFSGAVAEVGFNCECVGLTVERYVEVEVVAFLS